MRPAHCTSELRDVRIKTTAGQPCTTAVNGQREALTMATVAEQMVKTLVEAGADVKEDSMASPRINSIVESKQQQDQRDVRASDYDHRPQLIRPGRFRGKRCRDAQIKPLRQLMAAILSEAVNRFQSNLFQTSLSGRCEFVDAEFWLFKDDSEALFSFNNVSDFLSVDPRHIRQQLCDWRRDRFQAAGSTESIAKNPRPTPLLTRCNRQGT
jgi:hypothetical protein